MSEYTDSRSQPGRRGLTGTDDRELFMVKFAGDTLEAWAESMTYDGFSYEKSIDGAKADTFPIIGRKRDATEHNPGDEILGGVIEHNDVTIALDKMMIDSVFIAEIDELINHYDLSAPYSRQIGESLASVYDKRVAASHILASRITTPPYTGGPVPSFAYHANMRTDPAQLEAAHFAAAQYVKERDVGGILKSRLPFAQYLLLARWSGFQGGVPGSAAAPYVQDGRRTGEAFPIAGITIRPTNHIPSGTVTTGPTKYQGSFVNTVGHIGTEMAVGTLKRKPLTVNMMKVPNRLGTQIIGSQLYGHGPLRPECSFELSTSASRG